MHDDAYIGGGSENNIKCVVHDDLGWKNQTTRYVLELIQFFHGAIHIINDIQALHIKNSSKHNQLFLHS